MKIHQKIMDAMKPEFADEEPIVPFDFWQGANFRLRQRKVAGYPNYDKSEFDSPSALFDGDEEVEGSLGATVCSQRVCRIQQTTNLMMS